MLAGHARGLGQCQRSGSCGVGANAARPGIAETAELDQGVERGRAADRQQYGPGIVFLGSRTSPPRRRCSRSRRRRRCSGRPPRRRRRPRRREPRGRAVEARRLECQQSDPNEKDERHELRHREDVRHERPRLHAGRVDRAEYQDFERGDPLPRVPVPRPGSSISRSPTRMSEIPAHARIDVRPRHPSHREAHGRAERHLCVLVGATGAVGRARRLGGHGAQQR